MTMVTPTDSTPDSRAPGTVQGTPVVPGLAHGPALVVRGEVDPVAVARFGDGDFADDDAALAAYDDAATAVADGFTRTAARATGAATEVLTASAGLAKDKGLRSAVRKNLTPGPGWSRGERGRRPVRGAVHQHGRADGRAGHRPA